MGSTKSSNNGQKGVKMEPNHAKASRLPFSKTRLESLPVPSKGRKYHYDERTPGLALCITSAGTRTFYLYRKQLGRPVRIKIGRFPEVTVEQARKQAKKLGGALADGKDPQAAKRAQRRAPTLQDLFDLWMEYAKQHKKTWREDERKWKKYFAPLKSRRLMDLSTADVAKWHLALGKKHGPYLANRARALLSAMYSKAQDLGHTGPNPCEGVKKFKEESRDRFLQGDEFKPFFESLKQESQLWRDFWLLCLFTGARRGNVAEMAWQDLDLDRGIWLLPGQEMKNGLPVAIVLPPPAVDILQARKAQTNGCPWVFPGDAGHIVDPRKSWARVIKRAGIDNLRPHDLRRSLGSWQAIAGASLQIIGASLGHKDPKATAVYARLQLHPVRASVNGAVDAMVKAGSLKLTDETDEQEPRKETA